MGISNDSVYLLHCLKRFAPEAAFRGFVDGIEWFEQDAWDSDEGRPFGYRGWFDIFDDVWGNYPLEAYYPEGFKKGEKIVVKVFLARPGYSMCPLRCAHNIDWVHGDHGLVASRILPLWRDYFEAAEALDSEV